MTSINDTVAGSMQAAGLGRYLREATPVVQALIDREQRLFIGIVDYGVQMGGRRDQIVGALTALDMAAPTQPVAVSQPVAEMNEETATQPPFGTDTEQGETDLMDRVARLEEFARQYGFTL